MEFVMTHLHYKFIILIHPEYIIIVLQEILRNFTHTHTHIHTHIYIYTYIHIYTLV